MRNFLLEIGTEELPAGYIDSARKQLEDGARRLFTGNKINFSKLVALASFRRLVLLVDGLSDRQEDVKTTVPGPSKKAAFDEKGNPTPAAIGFAKSQGVEVETLVIKKKGKEERVFTEKTEKGKMTAKILPELIIKLISGIGFPKTMKWPQADFRFARPVRRVTALFKNKTIIFSLGEIKSERTTRGHKFITAKPVNIKDIEKYEKILRHNYVVVNQDERRELIYEAVTRVLKKTGGFLLEDDELLDEVNYLLEFPTPVLGQFDEKYLELPGVVLVTCMKHHQKYFSVINGDGELLPYFVGVRDGISEYMNNVKEGYERVLTARLEDAEFFFKQDTGRKLEVYVKELENVLFQEKTGTAFDKVLRIQELVKFMAEKTVSVKIDKESTLRAAYLCKADLMTQMVKEFPELQGIIGGEYAGISGEDDIVKRAISEHYMPLAADGKLPGSTEGTVVSIADKVDTIAGDFYAGRLPTGSGDPYGLRRQAHGVIRMLFENSLDLSLDELVHKSLELLKCPDVNGLKKQVMKFFRQRIEAVFEARGLRYDEIKAVLNTGFSVPLDVKARADAVHKLRGLPDFEPISAAFKRAKNILKQADEKFNLKVDGLRFNPDRLEEPEEKILFKKFSEVKKDVEEILGDRGYEEALNRLVGLRAPVDGFFDRVMVMDKNEKLRDNRLALLGSIIKLFMKIADFSLIVVDDASNKN